MKEPNLNNANNIMNKWNNNEKLTDYRIQEKILSYLFKTYPTNKNEYEISVKVKTLNLYYSTQVKATEQMKKHIYSKKKYIDKKLMKGDTSIVSEIANIKLSNGEKRCFYSFATKYCNFHNPKKYPIYDSIVRDLLYQYNKKYKFYKDGKYTKKDLKECNNYPQYKEMIDSFISRFKLKTLTYKDIDRYLWTKGKINSLK